MDAILWVWKSNTLLIISSVRYFLNAKISEYLGRENIHGQIQDLFMEASLSLHKMEQIHKASVVVVIITIFYATHRNRHREMKMTVSKYMIYSKYTHYP